MSERFDLETGVPVEGTARPPESPARAAGRGDAAPGDRRTPVAARGPTRPATTAHDPGRAAVRARLGLPLLFRPSLLLLLGAGLLGLAWIGYANPFMPLEQTLPYWPWQLFRTGLDQGGAVTFTWDRDRALALAGALLVLLLVVAAILRSSRVRAAFVLVLAAVAAAVFWEDVRIYVGTPWTWAPPIATALALGATLRRATLGGGRALVLGAGLLVTALLLLPGPEDLAWHPAVRTLADPFQGAVAGRTDLGLEHLLGTAAGWHVLGLAALLVCGLLGLVGLRGRWLAWLAGALVLATAVAPPLAASIAGLEPAPSAARPDTVVGLLARPPWILAAVGLVAALLCMRSLAGPGGSGVRLAGGVALYVLLLVVPSVYWCLSLAGAQGAPAFYRGLVGTTAWLGPALGAFLAPLVAATFDAGR